MSQRPSLPNGLVAIVKRECATCVMVTPVLARIAAEVGLTIYTQDDPTFPADLTALHDADLSVSWHHDIETVPTLLRVIDGQEVDRTVGWSRAAWQALTGIDDLGSDLSVMRPGCGSLSVDPNLEDELRALIKAVQA